MEKDLQTLEKEANIEEIIARGKRERRNKYLILLIFTGILLFLAFKDSLLN